MSGAATLDQKIANQRPLAAHYELNSDITPSPKSAKTGSRGLGLLDQIAGAATRDGASLWKSCFAEAIDIHLSLPSAATCPPFRNVKIGFKLEHAGRCFPSFCFTT
jgi:hypothetical protein